MRLFARGKKTVGLDVGSGLIKLVVIDHSSGEPELAKVAIARLTAPDEEPATEQAPPATERR